MPDPTACSGHDPTEDGVTEVVACIRVGLAAERGWGKDWRWSLFGEEDTSEEATTSHRGSCQRGGREGRVAREIVSRGEREGHQCVATVLAFLAWLAGHGHGWGARSRERVEW